MRSALPFLLLLLCASLLAEPFPALDKQMNPKGYYYTVRLLLTDAAHRDAARDAARLWIREGIPCSLREYPDPSDPKKVLLAVETGQGATVRQLRPVGAWLAHRGIDYTYTKVIPPADFVNPYALRPYETLQSLRPLSDSELRLMLQAFLYTNELENAYKVTVIALRHTPQSRYWHEKAAQISRWTGRRKETMSHLAWLYDDQPGEALRTRLIRDGIDTYRYDQAAPYAKDALIASPGPEEVDTFLFVWSAAGRPEAAADILASLRDNPYAKTKALGLYLELGRIDKAAPLIAYFQRHKPLDAQTSALLAWYFYLRHDFEAAYAAIATQPVHLDDPAILLQQISDLGWYLHDFRRAAKAGEFLMMRDEARLSDLERVVQYDKDHNTTLAISAAAKAWELFQKPYLFYNYAYLSLDFDTPKPLWEAMLAIEADPGKRALFEKQADYHLIKARLCEAMGKMHCSERALADADALSSGDLSVLQALLWFYLNHGKDESLAELLARLESMRSEPSLWLPMASAYYRLGAYERSGYYLRRLMQHDPENEDVRLLYAGWLRNCNRPDAAWGETAKSFRLLRRRLLQEPAQFRDPDFLSTYLTSAMYVLPPETFDALFRRAEPLLSPQQRNLIALDRAMLNADTESAETILSSLDNLEPWMKLALALQQEDNDALTQLLQDNPRTLPLRDAVTAALRTGARTQAHSFAFEGMQKSPCDPLLSLQFAQMVHEDATRWSVQGSGALRSALATKGAAFSYRSGLKEGGYLWEIEGRYDVQQSNDPGILHNIPASDSAATLGLSGGAGRTRWRISAGGRRAMESFPTAGISLSYRFASRLSFTGEADYNARADETLYTAVGGTKNRISASASFTLTPSTTLFFATEAARFSAQDGTHIGSGNLSRLQLLHTFTQGYPDLQGTLFAQQGLYRETAKAHGGIETLTPRGARVLPTDFSTFGFSLQYGTSSIGRHTRRWKPHLAIAPQYNTALRQVTFGLNAGLGGVAAGQDRFDIGLNYNEAVNGTDDRYLKLFINYMMWP